MKEETERFFAMASGRVPADLRIDNARVVDVFSGEVFEDSVRVGMGRILGFGMQDARRVVDARGHCLIPGLIDAHVHIESSMLSPRGFAELVLPSGTTTVIADPHEIANVRGTAGVRWMIDAARELPLDVRFMLPSCVPCLRSEDAGAVLEAQDLAPFADDPHVGGLAEMMNVPGLIMGDTDVLSKLDLASGQGMVIDGHAPMLSGQSLDLYAAMGVATDHECTTPDELRDRVRRGMYVLLREGSAARCLAALLPAVDRENLRRCLFCTDDRHAADILERGHIVNNLRLAVKAGLDPVSAVRMATLNAAECYGLRDRGAIAPGRRADMVLVSDLRSFGVLRCWARGELVAEDGRVCAPLTKIAPTPLLGSVNMAPLPPDPFSLRVPSGRARVIGMRPHSLLTDCVIREVRTSPGGNVDLALNPGLLKIAVIERHRATGRMAVGLLEGYGLRGGAIATTIAHDSHNLVVAGDDEGDMLAAVREAERLGGGIVMVSGGRTLCELPLPLGGLMSDEDPAFVAARLRELFELASSHYRIRDDVDAFMALSFLALPVIPSLKITARGLFDVDAFAFTDADAGGR
ncbi:MAG: adenine deaminase [Mailhella sp.]|nr:adenine deaminase [Mailhella sp.]